ncbi:MAG: SPOR domain-containing protein [Tahibacter sp.]
MKQRLIGAAVLIALAVIFVPMFLSSTPPNKDTVTEKLTIPPVPDREFQTRMVPADGGKATVPTPAPAAAAPSQAETDKVVSVEAGKNPRVEIPYEKTEPVKPAVATVKPPVPAATAPATPAAPTIAAPAAAPSASIPPSGGRYMVHLGVFANSTNANALVASAKKLGLSAVTETTLSDGKPATRVRIGPYADRTTAEAARLKLKQADPKLAASVIELAEAPTTDAPVAAVPANRAGGWAVQLGAFKSVEEANKLRDRLKVAGFAGFVDTVGKDGGKLWRVRAGPETDRAATERLRDAIKQKLAVADAVIVALP